MEKIFSVENELARKLKNWLFTHLLLKVKRFYVFQIHTLTYESLFAEETPSTLPHLKITPPATSTTATTISHMCENMYNHFPAKYILGYIRGSWVFFLFFFFWILLYRMVGQSKGRRTLELTENYKNGKQVVITWRPIKEMTVCQAYHNTEG